MKRPKQILLSFVGNNDIRALEQGENGSVLSILQQQQFDGLYLLYNAEPYLRAASEILKICRKQYPQMIVRYQEVQSCNPIDYSLVYPAMYQAVQQILQEEPDADFTISVTSGTPTMHACWLLLQQGGIIDAKLIQTSKEHGVQPVNLALDDFPRIVQPDQLKTEITRLTRENQALKTQINDDFSEIISASLAMERVKKAIQTQADYDSAVFIFGESGTGKELIARAIHFGSSRKEKPLITVNCAAISEKLFESEFFGHKKGSFTGAQQDQDGKFKQADGGTIFLDEVGELPLEHQAKLLRVLENGTIQPVGGQETRVDVRVVSASNKDLQQLVMKKQFREDLFYRLVQMRIQLPPLRERGDDLPLLADFFCRQFNQKYHQQKRLQTSAYKALAKHLFPGNIRELKNVIHRAYQMAEEWITAEHIEFFELRSIASIWLPPEGVDLDQDIIPQYYQEALKRNAHNMTAAAQLLGLNPHTFRERLRKLKIGKYSDDET